VKQLRSRLGGGLDWRLKEYVLPGNRARGDIEGNYPDFELKRDYSEFWDKPPPWTAQPVVNGGPAGGFIPAPAYLDVQQPGGATERVPLNSTAPTGATPSSSSSAPVVPAPAAVEPVPEPGPASSTSP
jgi:hypothetical protein